ncbi:glutaminase [Kribbella sp. NPDC000426]|uniref:glutaminase n=1 Tax=Kribbella sp. NPDC000426 TaxID=3154255 RepID=UPI00331E83EF
MILTEGRNHDGALGDDGRLYETSGEERYTIGLPGKGGIDGGIVMVSPGKSGLGGSSRPGSMRPATV